MLLSWRVQNIVVIGRIYLKLEHSEFSSNFEFDRNVLSGTGARGAWVNIWVVCLITFFIFARYFFLSHVQLIHSSLGDREDHYDDVIMSAIASQITSLTIVYSIVYSDADQRNHQSSAGTGEFPAQRASYAENVSIRWRHHVYLWLILSPSLSNWKYHLFR